MQVLVSEADPMPSPHAQKRWETRVPDEAEGTQPARMPQFSQAWTFIEFA
jgi:hypothetical protein